MSAGPSMRLRAVLLFELAPVIKGPLLWAALASLIVLVVPIRYIMVGDIYNNGELVGKALRLNYVVAIGYSTIVFLTTLFALCFCLDRAGNHYLRNNDLLILSRNVGRPAFYLAKIASVFMPALAYDGTEILMFGGTDTTNLANNGYLGDTYRRASATKAWGGVSYGPPSYLHAGAAAFDALRGRAVMYGGATWVWSQRGWDRHVTQVTTPYVPEPPFNSNMTMTYDSARDRFVLVVGSTTVAPRLWEFHGIGWVELATEPVNEISTRMTARVIRQDQRLRERRRRGDLLP